MAATVGFFFSKMTNAFSDKKEALRIDPVAAIFCLAMANLYEARSKPSLMNSELSYDPPSTTQFADRERKQVSAENLGSLSEPIQLLRRYWGNSNEDINFMVQEAVKGLDVIKATYNYLPESSTVQNTIAYCRLLLLSPHVENTTPLTPEEERFKNLWFTSTIKNAKDQYAIGKLPMLKQIVDAQQKTYYSMCINRAPSTNANWDGVEVNFGDDKDVQKVD